MSNIVYDIYNMNEADEKALWKDCVFVFDSSVLLNLYKMTEESLTTLKDIFYKIRGRLMLPNHVQYEYLKNRKHEAQKNKECYENLKNNEIKAVNNSYKSLFGQIKRLRNTVTKNDKHPFLDITFIDEFEKSAKSLEHDLEKFNKECEKQIKNRKKELSNLFEDDPVLDIVKTYFEIGHSYKFDKIKQIIEEGKLRYQLKMPPGFADEKEKTGIQVYGDLIIWKQIVEYSQQKKVNIVLITNDTSKKDWCFLEPNDSSAIERPHHKLIKEFNSASGKRFWMYTMVQFLDRSKKYLDMIVSEKMMEQMRDALRSFKIDDKEDVINLSFRCEKCSAVNKQKIIKSLLDYYSIENHKKEMEYEHLYMAEDSLSCLNCSSTIIANFFVWEHSRGCANDCDIELLGAELISFEPFTRDCLEDHWDDICQAMYEESL